MAAAYCLDPDDFKAFERRIIAFLKSGLFKPTAKTATSTSITGLRWEISKILIFSPYVRWANTMGLKAVGCLLHPIGIDVWGGYRFRFPLRQQWCARKERGRGKGL